MPKAIDLRGQVFGRLVAVKRDPLKIQNWICLCTCGKEKSIYLGSLRSGATKSCGCLHRENILRPIGQVAISHLFSRCRSNAKSRNHQFSITREDFERIIIGNCAYCGKEPAVFNPYCRKGEKICRIPGRHTSDTVDRSWIKANGIDRVDSAIGYTLANSVACCPECNISKNDRTTKDFIDHAKRVVAFWEASNV